MLVKIFLPSGKSAADVAFLFVHVKNFADALAAAIEPILK